jgi:predicted nucleic acid-binding protein
VSHHVHVADLPPLPVAYFDTAYLLRCYVPEHGADTVRSLAHKTAQLVTSELARAEFAAAVHRKRREKLLSVRDAKVVLDQFDTDCTDRVWEFLPVGTPVLQRVQAAFSSLPLSTPLRSADAIHLASAFVLGLPQIFSNDRHLLGAAKHFSIAGLDVIDPRAL